MTLATELERLAALHEKGALTAAEFAQAKARLLSQPSLPAEVATQVGQFRRSRGDRWLGGICGGLARLTDMESWVWRLIFAVLFFFWGSGLLLYILLWIFVPDE